MADYKEMRRIGLNQHVASILASAKNSIRSKYYDIARIQLDEAYESVFQMYSLAENDAEKLKMCNHLENIARWGIMCVDSE
jgi:hypothetical protein